MSRLPSVFISHGAPTFALEPGVAGPALTALGRKLPRPEAVLVVSPHWMTTAPLVGTTTRPRTIHDFGGFDPALYEMTYPVAGHPALARRAAALLAAAGWQSREDDQRGLDHGAWVPLMHLYPAADVPVFQVSLPGRLDGAQAFALGQALAPLSDEGVLVIGSGSLTHNLYEIQPGNSAAATYATEFVQWVRDAVTRRDWGAVQRTMESAPHARRAHPTTEHLLPLMVAAGASGSPTAVDVIDGGITYGVLSMESYVFGEAGHA
jgi:4,5-DOPA dioxygenase extradiol